MLKKEVKGDFDFFNIIMISEDGLLWVDLEINGGEELMKWWLKYANPTCCGGLGGVTAYQLHHWIDNKTQVKSTQNQKALFWYTKLIRYH